MSELIHQGLAQGRLRLGRCQRCDKNNHISENCFNKRLHVIIVKGQGSWLNNEEGQPHRIPVRPSTRQNRMQWIGERSLTPEYEYPLFSVAHYTIKPILIVSIEKRSIEVDTGTAVSLMSHVTQESVFPQATLQKSMHQ